MAEHPYTIVPGKLRTFLERIPSLGFPQQRVDSKYIAALGFKSSNDRTIIKVLQHVGLVDASGTPTEAWRQYRDRNSNRVVLAELVRSAYGDLYDTYPDAHARPDADIRNWISTRTGAGDEVVTKTVATFKALCSMADFTSLNSGGEFRDTHQMSDQAAVASAGPRARQVATVPQVHVNLQIHIPDTDDEEKIQRIFKHMARYIFGRETSE